MKTKFLNQIQFRLRAISASLAIVFLYFYGIVYLVYFHEDQRETFKINPYSHDDTLVFLPGDLLNTSAFNQQTQKEKIELPVLRIKNYHKDFTIRLSAEESMKFTFLARHFKYARYLTEKLIPVNIIFPFHYFW